MIFLYFHSFIVFYFLHPTRYITFELFNFLANSERNIEVMDAKIVITNTNICSYDQWFQQER